MQIYNEDGQMSLFDQDSWSGKMYRGRSPPGSRKAKTSGSSSRRSSVSSVMPYMFLDLTPGHGDLLGLPYWQTIYPLPGECWTLNTGECPNDVVESSLSQILQDDPPEKYYLSKQACLGILRRSCERGKDLPEKLKRALKIQTGVTPLDGQATELRAFAANQREKVNCCEAAREATLGCEVRDLNDVAGALSAQPGMKQQTFITQPDDPLTVFTVNQGDEVRDLHNVAGALCAQAGINHQTLITAGFSADNTGTLCLNDQGGSIMECSVDVTGTLRAQEHGHQPLVYENHGIDSRYTGPHSIAPTMSARYGTGGNNIPLVEQEPVYCIVGNVIDRQPKNGGNGKGYQEDVAYTLTAMDHHAVFSRQRVDVFKDDAVSSTQSARQHKDATDLVMDVAGLDCRNACENGDLCGTLQKDTSGSSLNSIHPIRNGLLIRRLTPLECERLQGFPDEWTDIPGASDSARYKALGNSVAIPCVEYVMRGLALTLRS